MLWPTLSSSYAQIVTQTLDLWRLYSYIRKIALRTANGDPFSTNGLVSEISFYLCLLKLQLGLPNPPIHNVFLMSPCILGFWKRNKRIWPPTYCIFKISLCGKSVFSICLISLYFSTPPPAPNPIGRSPHKWSLEFHFLHLYHQFIVSRPFHCSSRLLCVRIEYEYKYLSLSTSRLLEKYNQNLAFSYSSHSFSLSLSHHVPLMLRHRLHIILRLLTLFFFVVVWLTVASASALKSATKTQNKNKTRTTILSVLLFYVVDSVFVTFTTIWCWK